MTVSSTSATRSTAAAQPATCGCGSVTSMHTASSSFMYRSPEAAAAPPGTEGIAAGVPSAAPAAVPLRCEPPVRSLPGPSCPSASSHQNDPQSWTRLFAKNSGPGSLPLSVRSWVADETRHHLLPLEGLMRRQTAHLGCDETWGLLASPLELGCSACDAFGLRRPSAAPPASASLLARMLESTASWPVETSASVRPGRDYTDHTHAAKGSTSAGACIRAA